MTAATKSPTKTARSRRLNMTRREFWDIIEAAKTSGDLAGYIETHLRGLSTEAVADYVRHYTILHNRAYDWKLWGAANLASAYGSCGDDSFSDFRNGLIANGREYYEEALRNPDAISAMGSANDLFFESFGYIGYAVYEEKTGNWSVPRTEKAPRQPRGEKWDFNNHEENRGRLPKLAGR